MTRDAEEGLDDYISPRFKSSTEIALNPHDIDIHTIATYLDQQCADFQKEGSDCKTEAITSVFQSQ